MAEITLKPGPKLERSLKEIMKVNAVILNMGPTESPSDNPELAQYLDQMSEDFRERADEYKAMLDRLTLSADDHLTRADMHYTTSDHYSKMRDLIENKLVELMQKADVHHSVGETWVATVRELPKKLVVEPSFTDQMPDELTELRSVRLPIGDKIRAALERGQVVPGAELVKCYELKFGVLKRDSKGVELGPDEEVES